MSSLKNKVILITGASSGIGAGTAVEMAKLGCRLALNGRNLDNLEKTAQLCKEQGLPDSKIKLIVADVSKEEDCERILNETLDTFKELHVLVNNAGQLHPGTIETMTMDQYDTTMNVNVRSVVVLTKLAVPYLLKTKGNIVNVSSVAGLRPYPGIVAYNMSKAAIDQFTRSVALELADRGVRVNAVNPGVIITEVHKRGGMSEAEYEQFLEKCNSTHALGRPGTVDEVAKSIIFLASDDSSFITGVTLSIDGGRALMGVDPL